MIHSQNKGNWYHSIGNIKIYRNTTKGIVLRKMPRKKVICKVILQILIFLCLFACFIYFFMKDQMETFMKGRTTITRRVETVNSLEFPTITICFDPATKLSVAKKYGFNNYVQKFFSDVPNKTLPGVTFMHWASI